jgi:hypothetical protein
MAEADPSALTSPRFVFSNRGVPAISRSIFNFAGPIWRCVYPGLWAFMAQWGPPLPFSPPPVLRRAPGFSIGPVGPLYPLPFERLWDSTVPSLACTQWLI